MMTTSAPFDTHWTRPDGVRVSATGDPASCLLARFMTGYDRAFVLPDEREELEGFVQCLGLNASHRERFGRRHHELIATLEDAGGRLLAGTNFLAISVARPDQAVPATIALNYIYVEEAMRGRGLLRRMLDEVRTLALLSLDLDPAGPAPALFIEQNDPLRLTPEEYAADTRHSGLDQVDRLAIWARLGARVVDFDYVQPALSAGQNSDDGLIYAALDYPGDAVPANLFHDHLESFFRISVLKGEAEPVDKAASRQLAALAGRDAPVALLPMTQALERLRSGEAPIVCESFRILAREAMHDGDPGDAGRGGRL